MQRTRTVIWEDPREAAARGLELDGLAYLRAMADGTVPPPPMALLMDFRPVELAEGRVVFAGEPGEHVYNPIGVVHGGFAMTLLDSATGCAVQSTLPAGTRYTSLETKVNFVRPITLDTGLVLCEGTVVHRGSRVATADGRLTAEATGKLLAHGTSTCLVLG
jgi:uncharacterized protein (TIGR00369 family)